MVHEYNFSRQNEGGCVMSFCLQGSHPQYLPATTSV